MQAKEVGKARSPGMKPGKNNKARFGEAGLRKGKIDCS
jgi:hypothetical protein